MTAFSCARFGKTLPRGDEAKDLGKAGGCNFAAVWYRYALVDLSRRAAERAHRSGPEARAGNFRPLFN